MADEYSGGGSNYPAGSFYADLDARIQSLEAILGTAPGTVPDGSITTFKLTPTALSDNINSKAEKTALVDADLVPSLDSAASFGMKKISFANFITSIFTTARKIANGNFLTSFRLWDTTDPTKGLEFDLTGLTPGVVRKLKLANADTDLGNLPAVGLGYGQTWQTFVTTANVARQNTTGKPISVTSFAGSGLGIVYSVSTDNVTWSVVYDHAGSTSRAGVSFVLPNGFYYKTNTAAGMLELR